MRYSTWARAPLPYYVDDHVVLYCGDCRDVVPLMTPSSVDLMLVDPPYGDTSLSWDKKPFIDWLLCGQTALKRAASLWCFGSMRLLIGGLGPLFLANGWVFSQDLVWVKHNGSNWHNDRFRRVHEHILFFYRGVSRWTEVYKAVPYTLDAVKKTVRRKRRPPHMGYIAENSYYESVDGGPRLLPSVLPVRSCHGYARHPTQKPLGLLRYLVEYACPLGGVVLDPTCGVGSTLVAAKMLGRRAVGVEISPRYCAIAAERLSRVVGGCVSLRSG